MQQLKRLVPASVTLTCLLAGLLMPATALGLANPTPDQHWTAPNNNGTGQSVRAIVAASDGSYYVAGDFVDYSTSYGSAVLADASSSNLISPFPDVDGQVNAAISDGAGGWYIGGDFYRVGPLHREGLAHINADGTADADFDAELVLACGMCSPFSIKSLALDDTTGILYVGGNLDGATFGVTTVHGLVALNALTGTVSSGFNLPDISGADQSVYALALDEDALPNPLLFVGGSFTTIGAGTTRNNLVQFDAINGATTSYDPNVDSDVLALVLNPFNDYLYAGGIFTTVNGATPRNRVALFDPTGVVDVLFNPNADSTVNTLALDTDNGILYAGGNFANIGGQPRNRLAAVGMGDGVATVAFNPDVDDYVLKIALTADNNTLYAVGGFTYPDPITARDGIAAYDTSDGSVLSFEQSLGEAPTSIALSDDDETVLIGTEGSNYTADDTVFEASIFGETVILHILADGTVDPAFIGLPLGAYANGAVYAMALSPDEGTLYIGGDFTCAGGVFSFCAPRNRIAALDTDDGSALPFDPNVDSTVRALEISSDGATLYAGGDFSNVNGSTPRNGLAAFATIDGDATAFDADISGGAQAVYALALTDDDSTLYIGGDFSALNSPPAFRNNLAAVTTAAGLATAFDPDVNDNVLALALSGDGGTLYAGGDFGDVNNPIIGRAYAAAFNSTTGVATAFDPDADDRVFALAFGPDGILYMGGFFDTVGGEDHEYIAAVDADTGLPDAGFDANLEGASDAVYALAHGGSGNGLLAGGKFQQAFQDPDDTELPYVVANSLAHYADSATPTPTPATPTPTPQHSGGGGGAFLNPEQLARILGQPVPGGSPLTQYGLHEGDVMGAPTEGDPDVYIVNEWGFKRLFLNPVIFSFYGHLGFAKVKGISGVGRDAFPISGLFRNCEANDPKVYAVEVTGEDTGVLHHVNVSGDVAVAQDPDFFHKVFCINNNEFNWYPKSPTPYTSLSQVPVYHRP